MAKRTARTTKIEPASRPKARPALRQPTPSTSSVTSIPPEVAYARAELIFEQHAAELAQIPGVLSVDVGLRYRAHRLTGEVAVRVHVAKKLPQASLGQDVVPREIDGVPVDVIERNYALSRRTGLVSGSPDELRSLQDQAARIAPSHLPEWFGTAAAAVQDLVRTEQGFVVTCAHVLAADRPVVVLDQTSVEILDGEGELVGFSLPGRWCLDESVDAALFALSDAADRLLEQLPLVRRLGRLTHQDVIDRVAVWKRGAQTGFSIGHVDSVRSLPIPIRMPDGSMVLARNQVQIRAADGRRWFAARGDSGSAILRATPEGAHEWVALLRAVDPHGFAIACHADLVAAKLGVLV